MSPDRHPTCRAHRRGFEDDLRSLHTADEIGRPQQQNMPSLMAAFKPEHTQETIVTQLLAYPQRLKSLVDAKPPGVLAQNDEAQSSVPGPLAQVRGTVGPVGEGRMDVEHSTVIGH
jgi:hypothetical protein